MELVTGFAGSEHIEAIDTARLIASIVGTGSYLLTTQKKLAAKLETANKLTIDTGDFIFQGRHVTLTKPESITLESGTTGKKFNYLICARYEKSSSTKVETVTWKAIKGTATTGTPSDPSHVTGDILNSDASVHEEPVFRIEVNGITPGKPIMLLEEYTPSADYRDYVSQTKTWGNSKVIFTRVGNIVICHGQVDVTIAAWSTVELCDIPNGYKPIAEVFAPAVARDYLNARVNATVAGKLTAMSLKNPIEGNIGIVFELVWLTA